MIEVLAHQSSGRFSIEELADFRQSLKRLADGDYVLTVEPLSELGCDIPKSRKQEKGFHAMIQPWAKSEGHQIDDLKRDLLRHIFGEREHLNPITGEVTMVLREPHTSKLNRAKYSELIERTLEVAAACGHVLIAPNEWRMEQERKRRAA